MPSVISRHITKITCQNFNVIIFVPMTRMAAFQSMHVSPVTANSVTTGQTHGQTDARHSDPYVPQCFTGETKTHFCQIHQKSSL